MSSDVINFFHISIKKLQYKNLEFPSNSKEQDKIDYISIFMRNKNVCL